MGHIIKSKNSRFSRTIQTRDKVKVHKTINSRTDFFYYTFRNLIVIGFPLFVVSGLLLSIPHSSADNGAVNRLTLTIPSSCTLSSSNNEYSYNTLGGTYNDNIGTTAIKTICNDAEGFVIYATGFGNNEEGNNKLVSSLGTSHDIASGTATSGNVSNWSMKVSSDNNVNYPLVLEPGFNANSYVVVPDAWTKIATRSSGTDTPVGTTEAEGSSMTTTYAAYITSGQPAGTYIGQVMYALLHPSNSTNPTTLAEAYKNAGKSKVYTTDPITGDSGYFYTMQDMTSSICNAVNVYGEASQTQLVDIRDGKLYWATKLHTDKYNDNVGQCWMTQNLDLDLISDTTADNYVALTSENTDFNLYGSKGYDNSVVSGASNGYSCSNDSPTCEGGTITWLPERTTIAPSDLNSTTWKNDNSNPYSHDRGLYYPDSSVSAAIAGSHGLAGNYYNWTAAIASNNSASYTGGNAANSICPKGWRLPNTTNFEFSKLLYAYNITKDDKNTVGYANGTTSFNRMITSPLWFVRGGVISNGNLYGDAATGYFGSGTAYSSSLFLRLVFQNNILYPADAGTSGWNYGRSGGYSLRCLAR